MFIAILFIAIGIAILLNTLGLLNGMFWGIFWGVFFLAVGIKMGMKKGGCPICSGHWKSGGFKERFGGHCCGGHNHAEEGKTEK